MTGKDSFSSTCWSVHCCTDVCHLVWHDAGKQLAFVLVVHCASCSVSLSKSKLLSLSCRGVATITGLMVQRQDAAADAGGGSAPDPAAANKDQQHQLLLWPQCGQCEQQQLPAALEVAQPQQQTELQLVVLPSTMPAELLMTHQGEVRVQPLLCSWPQHL
jgi:hypothetical protein